MSSDDRQLSDSVMDDSLTHGSPETPNGHAEEPAIKGLPYIRRITYGVGHVFNDLCASMWFTYFLLFYHLVLRISNTYAGMLVLIGQVADALTTPVVGYLCDTTHNRYGGRKTWHLIGTAMVAISLFFIWHECIYCNEQPVGYQMLYFSCFIIVFQVGWATVQVSHLSLIPSLTCNESIRVELNSIRYAFTILSNSGIFIAMLILLAVVNPSTENTFTSNDGNSTTKISPDDEWIFSGVALGIIVIGLTFAAIFHIGTKEPSSRSPSNIIDQSSSVSIPWYRWFLNPNFYMVAVIYMCSRLIVNLTQVYSPLYMYDSLGFSRLSVAIIPLVIFFSGLIATFFLRLVNYLIGRYASYFCGLLLIWGALIWFYFWPSSDDNNLFNPSVTINFIYMAGILTGVGGTTLLVTSLSMVADLIGDKCRNSAFVYGAMSFTDKLSSGIAIQIIQLLHPCKEEVCCSACGGYYRGVLTYVPGGASIVAFIMLLVIVSILLIKKFRRSKVVFVSIDQSTSPEPSAAIRPNTSHTVQGGSLLSSRQSYDEKAPLINKIK